jgi:hypothetical protein
METQQRVPPFTEVSSLHSLATYLLRDGLGEFGSTFNKGANRQFDYSILHSTVINAYHNPDKFQKEFIRIIENNEEFYRFDRFLAQLKNNNDYIKNIKIQAKETYDSDPAERHKDRPLDFIFIMILWMYIWH